MKNTLLAVLIIAICYDHAQAQSTLLPVIIADGTRSTDKLANDLMAAGKPTGVAIHSNHLPTTSITTYKTLWQRFMQCYPALQQPAQTSLSVDRSPGVEGQSYAGCVQHPLLPVHPLPKPRPLNRRTGWLQ